MHFLSILFLYIFVIQISSVEAQEAYGTYGLYPQGSARVTAMGGAFVGLSDDVNGIFYNPAGLIFGDGIGELGGDRNHVSNGEADLDGDGTNDGLPYDYLNYGALLRWGRFAFGLGVFGSYQLNQSFTGTSGAYTETRILDLIIGGVALPISFKWNDRLSIGVTLHGQTLLQRFRYSSTNPISSSIDIETEVEEVSSSTFGFLYKSSEMVQVGVAYTSSRRFDVNESLNLQTGGVNWFRDAVVPGKFTVGMKFDIKPKLILVVDLDFIEKPKNLVYVGSELISGLKRIEILEKERIIVHGGVEWHLYESMWWDFYARGGFYTEPARIEGALSRTHTTAGFGVRWGYLFLEGAADISDDFFNYTLGLGLSLKML